MIICIRYHAKNDAEQNVAGHLFRYIKSLTDDKIRELLCFITGGDFMPFKDIQLTFVPNQRPRAPVARIGVKACRIEKNSL